MIINEYTLLQKMVLLKYGILEQMDTKEHLKREKNVLLIL